MKSNEFITDAINPEGFKRGFERTKPFGKYMLIATPGEMPYIPGKKARVSDQFRIEAYDGKEKVGFTNFQVIDDHLEAIDVIVKKGYRRQGIASAMYEFAQELGNDIQPSSMQTPDGKAFWKGKK